MLSIRQWFQGSIRDERGEGVISTAIAVLVMAVIGAAMYAAFNISFGNVQTSVDQQISDISGGS